jgi:myo-inositol-1(or 4)-monophosphatase
MSRTALDLDALVTAARAAACAGGDVIVGHVGELYDIRAKAPGDWVSQVDVASEHAVREVLVRETGIAVHGEEHGGARADTEWLVDPLDGTTNFLHGFDAFGVSVGLVHEGRPVVGVVHAPLLAGADGRLGRTYWAAERHGAFRDGVAIAVSAREPLHAIVATGFPFRSKHLLPQHLAAFEPVLHRFEDVRRVGAASLDLCWVADGTFEGYFELRLGPWDVAAGGVIVREAGGIVTDWTGDDTAWLNSGDVVAAAPLVHAELLAATTRAQGDCEPGPPGNPIAE